MHLKDLWDRVGDNALNAMANAIDMARQITGSDKVIISGEGATITDACLSALQIRLKDMKVERSNLGEKANSMAAAEIALDKWVYMTTLLEKVKDWL